MDITFEQIETRLNNTRMKARVNKMVVSKPYIIESKISIVPNDIINKLFETNEQVTDILVTYNKKTKEILKIKAKMAKEELLLLRISDSEGMAGLLGLMPTNNVVEWIMTVNNLYSHNTNINAIEIHNRPERFYIITLKTYNDRYKTIGIIALYIRGSQKNRRGEISRFVILPPYQNKKYGQTALKKAIKLIQYNELKPFVWVREDNEIMQHIVEKLGFKSTDRSRHNNEIDKDFIKWVYDNGEIETVELDKIEINSNPLMPNSAHESNNSVSDILLRRISTTTSEHSSLCICPYCVEKRRAKQLSQREEQNRESSREHGRPVLRHTDNQQTSHVTRRPLETPQEFVNRVMDNNPEVIHLSISDGYYGYFDTQISPSEFIDARRNYINIRHPNRRNE